MDRATNSLSPEQQELLDSGLRILAHMIAETHLRRTASNAMGGKAPLADGGKHSKLPRETPEKLPDEDRPGSYHE